ncbi:MAG: DNA mismatch repair endonuclease MutL [Gemmatimonadales bacterium]|nr:MAG: DNA mismatch repair endonuclease MutL [Gemmatimonadales bacterium]
MARTIQILADSVANQIAAGEVVERPASVVKELVENALDARATRVEVAVDQGGRRRIRVSDDGTGMGREDALLSLDRHATSKIRTAEELRGVRSFGFRGEALPSIASVSRFTLETCARGEEVGTRIRVRGGTVLAVEDCARTPGTTVEVESLFLNAPARRKFLRSSAVETRAISEVLAPLSLAHPRVDLVLRSGERSLLEVPGTGDLVARVRALWGDEGADGLIPVEHDGEVAAVRGLVQRPDRARPGFRRVQLLVDGRPFRDAGILAAADRGYRTTIPQGTRPWIILFLEVPGGTADVNVHPTKAEVRFRVRGTVEADVEEAVRRALEREESAATLGSAPATGAMQARESAGPARRPSAGKGTESEGAGEAQIVLFGTVGATEPAPGPAEEEKGRGGASHEIDPGVADLLDGARGPRLWQVHRAWILAEVRSGLLLIDQHAAHERILFERIMERFDAGGEGGQRLLFPLTLRLTVPEVEMVQSLAGLLHRAGFEAEPFGGDTVILHSVPNPHPYFDAERAFREMIDELTHGSDLVRSARNQHERLAMSFACKAAIKAGQALDDQEIQELFDQLFATRLPWHDVHGRPTTVRLSLGELERKFGR